MPISKPDYALPEKYRQMALGLDLPEVELDGVSLEEARRRSEVARSALESLRSKEEYPWLEDYLKLLDGGWPWRQAAYIAWASSPKTTRTPKSQDELARLHLGLTSDRAISTWRKHNDAIDEMIAFLQAAPLWETRADDFAALTQGAAKAGSDYKFFNHLKLKLEMRGDYVPKSELEALLKAKAISGDLSDVSREELERQAKLDSGETGRGLE